MQTGDRRWSVPLGEQEWPIWVVTGALPLTLPPISIVFYRQLLNSGTLDPMADSIAIPIMGHIMATFVIAPVVLAITWACLWRYEGGGDLVGWDGQRPWRSLAATLVLGIPAVTIAGGVAADIVAGQVWYEYLWNFYFGLWATWFLLLRAALLAPPGAESSEAPVEE